MVAPAGKIGFVIQLVILLITTETFFAFSSNALRPIYQGWFLATLTSLQTGNCEDRNGVGFGRVNVDEAVKLALGK